jgi:hypothetical protein
MPDYEIIDGWARCLPGCAPSSPSQCENASLITGDPEMRWLGYELTVEWIGR